MSKRPLAVIILITCSCLLLFAELYAEEPQKNDTTIQEASDEANDPGKASQPIKQKTQQPTDSSELPIIKKDLGGEEIYFDLTYLNLFNYGLGFVFGFNEVIYGVQGMLGYRHLNTFTGFPGTEGGTRAALDIFVEGGASIASVDGRSVVGGFLSVTAASNILWFKPLNKGNHDRSGNGIFVGAKIEAAYTEEGFTLGYGPAIGWTSLHYNTEKKKFRATNITLFFYPPTMVIGLGISTNF